MKKDIYQDTNLRSNNRDEIYADQKAVNLNACFWTWFFITAVLELCFVIGIMIWSVNDPSWTSDAYITTCGYIGVYSIPFAVAIGIIIWHA